MKTDPPTPSINHAPHTRTFAQPTADVLFGLGRDHTAELTIGADAIRANPFWIDMLINDLERLREALEGWEPDDFPAAGQREGNENVKLIDQLRELTR